MIERVLVRSDGEVSSRRHVNDNVRNRPSDLRKCLSRFYRFYTADSTPNLIDGLQLALFKRGIPKTIYADNGSNYSSLEFATICDRMGTALIHTPVRDGAAKGKIERFFRTVRDQFLLRDLSAITSLKQLNEHFHRWA